MELIFETYKATLVDNKDYTCKVRISPNKGEALKAERRKLYVIYCGDQILYIGEANTSIKTRFQRGCTSFNFYIKNDQARGGYKGYKWLNKEHNSERELKVCVVIFPKEYDDDKKREFIEAIEGELVYLIRQKTDKWPLFQNEIHFHNHAESKEIAKDILKKAFEGKLI